MPELPNEGQKIWSSIVRFAEILKASAAVRGRLDPALDTVLNIDLQEIRIKSLQVSVARVMGETYLYIDDSHMDEAEAWIKKAIETDEKHRMPWDLARDYALYSEFFKKKGDTTQAKEKLGKAIDLMRSIGAAGWVKRYEKELACLIIPEYRRLL